MLSIFSFHRRYSSVEKTPVAPVIKIEKEIERIPTSKLSQSKKDKRIQENYKAILLDYKRNLSSREYKIFQADTQYDILIYDALMVSRDKEGNMLTKLEHEK